ncbi:MAG: sugar phosphate isomerase/epimerase [Clostridia bacterium]|nr:sugar phosphate isomerase/epimerase [Clostridia bacterium]
MKFPIALQLYSVRDDLAADFEGTLRQAKAMGYDGVEFAGLYGHPAAEVKVLCGELGLVPVSAHVPFVDMMANPEILRDYAEIGCAYVVIPYLTEEYRPGQPKFAEVIAGAKLLGEKANALGMKLCYHNHDFEFVKVDGEYALDVLYSEVSADLLQTQIDTCWVHVAGVDPAAYVRKYAGRAEIVHLKDYAGQKSEHMYALIGIDDEKKAEGTGAFEFRPVGCGKQDFPALLSACEDAGAKWVVVEQDQPSMGKTPLECAKLSIDYLRSL